MPSIIQVTPLLGAPPSSSSSSSSSPSSASRAPPTPAHKQQHHQQQHHHRHHRRRSSSATQEEDAMEEDDDGGKNEAAKEEEAKEADGEEEEEGDGGMEQGWDSVGSPLASLLEIDGCRLLLDCGWTEQFDERLLAPLRKIAKTVDAVLISHPSIEHLGALPYAVAKLGLTCPILATLPVHDLGQMFLYDAFLARSQGEDFTAFSLDEVDAAFDDKRWILLKYRQRYPLGERGQGIVITPHAAGHSIGGTVWMISKETDEIVYAVHFNHRKEKLLQGTVLDTLEKPNLLITDSVNALSVQPPLKKRDKELMDEIIFTLSKRGNVLIPVDSACRSLELALMLEQHWNYNTNDVRRLGNELVFLSHQSFNTMNFAQTMTEWMNEDIAHTSPFQFKHLKLCHNMREVRSITAPKVVLASTASLDVGFSRDLFIEWVSNPDNCIVFVQRGPPKSLSRHILESPSHDIHSLTLEYRYRQELVGEELESHRRKQQILSQQQAQAEAAMRASSLMKDEDMFGSDDDDEDDDENDMGSVVPSSASVSSSSSSAPMHTLSHHASKSFSEDDDTRAQPTDSVYRYDTLLKDQAAPVGFFKPARTHPMFPCIEPKVRMDDYGEPIDLAHFTSGPSAASPSMDTAPGHQQQQQQQQQHQPMEVDSAQPIPTKVVAETITLKFLCRHVYIDFEGLSDGQSIKTILSKIAPRKLMLVHGERHTSQHLLQHFRPQTDDGSMQAFAPSLGETVDVSSTTNIFQVKLTDALMSSIRTVSINDYTLAYVQGRMQFDSNSASVAALSSDSASGVPSIVPLQRSSASSLGSTSTPSVATATSPSVLSAPTMPFDASSGSLSDYLADSHEPILVGEVMLLQFKTLLQKHGFQVDFAEGVLMCNNEVAIRKTATGRLTFEGSLTPVYFKVRELLYQQYAIL